MWLKMSSRLLALVLLMVLSWSSGLGQKRAQSIGNLRIASMPYRSETVMDISPKRLLERSGMINSTIFDPELYKYLDSIVKNIKIDADSSGGDDLDARVACVIYRDGGRNDTLSFGAYHMRLNRRTGYLQPGILLRIAEMLPCSYIGGIHDFLKNFLRLNPRVPAYGYGASD